MQAPKAGKKGENEIVEREKSAKYDQSNLEIATSDLTSFPLATHRPDIQPRSDPRWSRTTHDWSNNSPWDKPSRLLRIQKSSLSVCSGTRVPYWLFSRSFWWS